MKNIVFIQARLNSTRFPNKILSKYKKYTMLEILINRLKLSKKINKIVVITPSLERKSKIGKIVKKLNIPIFYGSENNVLKRYYEAAKKFKADNIIRITSDCPLIDPFLLDRMLDKYEKSKYDYLSNTLKPTFPDGLDIEIFNKNTLKLANNEAKTLHDLEHVTPYIKLNKKFKKYNFFLKTDKSNLRITLDTRDDLENIKKILNYFSPDFNFKYQEILNLPKNIIKKITYDRQNTEGLKLGDKLWIRAQSVIPDGNSFFSKRPNLFLKKNWPTYFSKARGCYIWDLEKKKYIDFSFMGVGTNVLGYSNKNVDNEVKKIINKSNMSTLNSLEEVLLAEKLIELNPWAKKVKFARSGGEANLLAIRISRAYTGKHKVAFCGYHGWHDWYLSSNIQNKNTLNSHLFSDLKIEGVPKFLKKTSYSFNYNDYSTFKRLIEENKDIGTVIMEVTRNFAPKLNFLKKIRKVCDEKNITLIFDECTSGFRETLGGIHKNYNVYPDIAVYGKALGNGYPINAIVGKDEIMKSARKSFMSSTFWSERIGFVAALATIKQMEKIKSWRQTKKIGKEIKVYWKKIFNKYKIEADIIGLDSIPSFIFKENNVIRKTFITKELLNKGILAGNSFYVSTAHKKNIMKVYFKEFEKVIAKLKKDKNIEENLEGYKSENTFKRLN